MRLDYIVSRIETSQDNNSFAYVTFSNPNDGPTCPFGPNKMAFTSPEDLMKNLPKAMANIGGGGILTDSPTFKFSMRE